MKHLHPTLIQECVDRMRKISGQSKLTKRPHRRLTWTVQPYSLGGTDVHPNLTRASPGPIRVHTPNRISIRSAVFYCTALGRSTLWAAIFPQNCRYAWETWPPSNTCFLWPTRLHSTNGISIGSAVFAWLTIVTDRQTDRQTRHALLRL